MLFFLTLFFDQNDLLPSVANVLITLTALSFAMNYYLDFRN